MYPSKRFSRRHFVGGAASALGYLGLKPGGDLWAQGLGLNSPMGEQEYDYDALAHLGSNENPWGPPESAMEAMNYAWKYSMRYGYPNGGIQDAIAEDHGVSRSNILMGAGSREILLVMGLTFMAPGKKVVGVEPSYSTVYEHATGLKAETILLSLDDDYRQNIPKMIEAVNRNHRDVGFVYLCNPNNPTGIIVTAAEVKQLLDGIPEDVPVLIDEAYHHFVEDPEYAPSLPYVLEGRPVVIARTFSKIYGLAAMRMGYAIATPEIIDQMSVFSTGNLNCLVQWGGVAAMKDTEAAERVRSVTIARRKKYVAKLEGMGYDVIPSETNFFMVHTGRPAREVRDEFRKRGVAVGRPFPPMLDHLRVSIGTEEEMERFMTAWGEIFSTTATGSRGA